MPIIRRNAITKQDFEDALDYLGSSISKIAQASGAPRAYLSDLKNRNIRLRREYEDKLRAYLQASGVEFEDDPADTAKPPRSALADATPKTPHSALAAATVTRCFFPVDDSLDDDVIERAIDAMDENDARIAELRSQPAEREVALPFMGEGGYTKDTQAALQEIKDLSAENWLLFSQVCRRRALRVTPSEQGKETLRDVVIADHQSRLVEVGLIPEPEPEPEEEAA